MRVFAYLNIDHPMVAWEVAIGRVASVTDQSETSFGVSLWSYSRLAGYARSNGSQLLLQELRLEQLRQEAHADKVSRLQGAYFFQSQSDVQTALNRWGIRINPEYISEIELEPNAVSIHDSEWITDHLANDKSSDWMHEYWNGSTSGERPLSEMLVVGRGVVLNQDLRVRAYRSVLERWPTSTPLLSAACCTFWLGRRLNICRVVPAIVANDNGIEGAFYIDMREFNAYQGEVVAAVVECRERNFQPPVVMPKDEMKIFTLPDLRDLSFRLSGAEFVTAFEGIHHAP